MSLIEWRLAGCKLNLLLDIRIVTEKRDIDPEIKSGGIKRTVFMPVNCLFHCILCISLG